MKRRLLLNLVLVVGVLAISIPLLAHHGNAAFDTGKKLEMKGTVTEWIWANPHCWLKFDVKDENGKVTNWVAESNNAADMLEKGWSKQILKTGDAVTVTLEPVKNGNPVGRLITVLMPDGHLLGMAYLKR